MAKATAVFIRDATGLVREFSWFDAFAITFNATLAFSLLIVTPAIGLFPGTNPMIALVLLLVLAIFYSINFGWLAMAMPRRRRTVRVDKWYRIQHRKSCSS